jgi:hypothetical protein
MRRGKLPFIPVGIAINASWNKHRVAHGLFSKGKRALSERRSPQITGQMDNSFQYENPTVCVQRSYDADGRHVDDSRIPYSWKIHQLSPVADAKSVIDALPEPELVDHAGKFNGRPDCAVATEKVEPDPAAEPEPDPEPEPETESEPEQEQPRHRPDKIHWFPKD